MKLSKKKYLQLKATLNTLKLAMMLLETSKNNKIRKRKPKRFWVREFLKHRKTKGAYHTLVQEITNPDQNETRAEVYLNYFRMSPSTMNLLLSKVGPLIQKISWVREAISPAERLALTIRYLCSGDSMSSISYAFRVGYSTVSRIIRETTPAIYTVLKDEYLRENYSEQMWRNIASEFHEKWNFPHCCGAFDGKHVNVQAFRNAGSTCFNYKGTHSVVLMALADASYRFIAVDVGAEGRFSDGGVFRSWNFGKAVIENPNAISLPGPEALPNTHEICPFVFVGDEAFPLLPNLMRPYPGRGSNTRMPRQKAIYNYRLSRARRVVENTFGIWCNRFRIFRKPILAKKQTVIDIVHAAVVLHNFLIEHESSYVTTALRDMEQNVMTATNNYGLTPMPGSYLVNRPTKSGTEVRDKFCQYFNGEGAVNFQEQHLFNVV